MCVCVCVCVGTEREGGTQRAEGGGESKERGAANELANSMCVNLSS